jgi:hypothetical protein
LAKALAATLDADKRQQDKNVKAAREAFERLRMVANKANAAMEKNTVLPFVLNLLVTDFGDLVTTVEGKEG